MNTKYYKTYKTNIYSLGDIELKNVSLNDLIKYDELKFYELSDRDFITSVLHNQLLKPKIDLDSFKARPDTDIEELARVFLKQEDHYNSLFKETGDFFGDFKKVFIESRKELIKQIRKVFRPLISFQKAINPCNKILAKYKWFVTPSFPLSFVSMVKNIKKEKGRKDKDVNQLFIKYFEANEWQNLEIMVNEWKGNNLLKKRRKILLDCVHIVKLSYKNGINAANVVMPTLITQIDGFLSDYLNLKGVKYNSTYKTKKNQFKTLNLRVLPTPFNETAFKIFLDILLQESWAGKPLAKSFYFNRHKISHGETTKYGRKDYMIRAFMILDLLSNL